MYAFTSIAVVALAATLGDLIWYTAGVRHTVTAGVLHGALLLTVVGAAIGAASGRLVKGLPIGALAGVGAALSYYLLVAIADTRTYGTAIPAAWVIMWLLLAALDGRWLRAPYRRPWSVIAIRGGLAAVASGVAFALIRHVLWGPPPAAGRSYIVQFFAWAIAWAPGLLALTWTTSREDARSVPPSEVWARLQRGDRPFIVDVRSEAEFAAGHVPGAMNLPLHRLLAHVDDVSDGADEELFLYCGHGPRARMAATALRSRGRARIVYMKGHFAAWRRGGFAIEKGQDA
jgi:rhodanese-related sulfurtransferase